MEPKNNIEPKNKTKKQDRTFKKNLSNNEKDNPFLKRNNQFK